MASKSVPITTYVASPLLTTGVQSAVVSQIYNLQSVFEGQIPIQIIYGASAVANPIVNVFRSMDNGNNYDTQAMTSFNMPVVQSGLGQYSIALPTGQYALQVVMSTTGTIIFATYAQVAYISNTP
jgi:hypothetical protein